MLTVFGAIAELERDYILHRQAEGIAIAKQLGKYNGRKKMRLTKINLKSFIDRGKTEKLQR